MSNNNSFKIENYKKTLSADLVIRKVGHGNTIDIFYGNNGWEPHARFNSKRTSRGTFLTQILGNKVPSHIFKQLINQVQ